MQIYISKTFSACASNVQLIYIFDKEIRDNHEVLKNVDIIIIALNFDLLYPNILNDVMLNKVLTGDITKATIMMCRELYYSIKDCSKAKVIWFGFEDYYTNNDVVYGTIPMLGGLIDIINQAIINLLINDTYIDFKQIIAKVGILNAYENKGKYRWNAPYSEKLMELMAKEVYKQYLIHIGRTKKCIVLDCDDVLWGGAISEDGIDGIHLGSNGLGREYQDFQRFLLNLYNHGVILTVCSKNDERDVLRVFHKHSGMVLKKAHIACFKVNWNDKPTNIKLISDELNIGINSMVFIDDSLFEIEAAKSFLPDLTTIQYDRDLMYNNFSCFNLKNKVNLLDIEHRNETYRTNQFRRDLKAQCDSYDEYIKSLNIKVDIHQILPMEYNRVAEITQRTNKFTNGKRYTVSEIKKQINLSDVYFYSVSVSDCFSDLGIVGAIAIEKDTLSLFSLSCRALGRGIEQKMINYITGKYSIKDFYFTSTGNNKKVHDLLKVSFNIK